MPPGHVLAIDDEPHILNLYKDELESEGYKVIMSDGTGNILEQITADKPDAVILDIKLGNNISGLDLLQAIKSNFPALPVIIATAYPLFKNDLKAVAANHYIIKSIDLKELKTKLAESIDTAKRDQQ